MHIAKNQFLLDTDVANVAKARLYNSDLPALHDDFQLLEASSVAQLVHLLGTFVGVQRDSLGTLLESVGIAESAVGTIDIEKDQALFAGQHSAAKLAAWELPRDVAFEECPVWHDTVRSRVLLGANKNSADGCLAPRAQPQDEMSTTPPSVVYLQNVKSKAVARLADVTPAIESKRREISGLRNLREAYERDRSLGDAGSVLVVGSCLRIICLVLSCARTEPV
jgi:hypothetical protein